MTDYTKLRQDSAQNRDLTGELIDDFLIHHAVAKDKLDREFDKRVAEFKHLTQKDPAWTRMIKSQYIVHRIFKEDGLLSTYLKQPELKNRSKDEKDFLKEQIIIPWRFSFSRIVDSPSPDFYNMEDVMLGTTFLLYSRSITLILEDRSPMLWFNLISFNGSCWQSYGPVNAYESFDADDIFFFATQLDEDIESDAEAAIDVEENPVPYMMLVQNGQMPRTLTSDYEVFIIFSVEERDELDVESLRKDFKVEYNENIFRITVDEFFKPPHMAAAYYDEVEGMIMISATTEPGYSSLVNRLNEYGFDISVEPHVRVHPSMIVTIGLVLQEELNLNPYEHLFDNDLPDDENGEMDQINNFIEMVLPIIMSGKEIDVEALAKESGLDVELVKQMVESIVGKTRKK